MVRCLVKLYVDKMSYCILKTNIQVKFYMQIRPVFSGPVTYVEKLDDIEKKHPGNKERRCAEMFKYWLEVDSEANWNKLTDALKQTGQRLGHQLKGSKMFYKV